MLLYRVIKVSFDNYENQVANAIVRTVIGTFTDGDGRTAYAKIDEALKAQKPCRPYIGHDFEVYPKYLIETDRAQ